MIVDGFFDMLFGALSWLVGLLPVLSNEGMPVVEDGFIVWLAGVSYFLPLWAMGLCLGWVLFVCSIQNQFFVINWVIKRIRGG